MFCRSFLGALLIAFGVSSFASAQQLDCRAGFDDLQGAKSPLSTFKNYIKHTIEKKFPHLVPDTPKVKKIIRDFEEYFSGWRSSASLPEVPIESLTPLEINQLLRSRHSLLWPPHRDLSWQRGLLTSINYENMTDDVMQLSTRENLYYIDPHHFQKLGFHGQIFKLPKTLTRAPDEQFQAAIGGFLFPANHPEEGYKLDVVHQLKKMPLWFFIDNAYRLPLLSDRDKREVLEDLGFKGRALQILMQNSKPVDEDKVFLANLRQEYQDSKTQQHVFYSENDRQRYLRTVQRLEEEYGTGGGGTPSAASIRVKRVEIKRLKEQIKDLKDDINQRKREKQGSMQLKLP